MKAPTFLIAVFIFAGSWVGPVFAGPNDLPAAETHDRGERDQDDREEWFEDAPGSQEGSLEDRVLTELQELKEEKEEGLSDRKDASKGVPEDSLGPREIVDLGDGHLGETAPDGDTLSVPDHTTAAAPVRRKFLERSLTPLEHQEETTAAPHDRVKPIRAALDRERKQDQLVNAASDGRVLTVSSESSTTTDTDAEDSAD